jgi:pSer/pThr/pTyr-binding forkhead associated (FHA) protein
LEHRVTLMIMSGVEDGSSLEYSTDQADGLLSEDRWTISIGRRDDNDICLRNDTYVSRQHAYLHWLEETWWLEDCESTNGTFLDNPENFFEDQPVKGRIKINNGQLFRVGRTWLRIQPVE